jgi:hypothetical protein
MYYFCAAAGSFTLKSSALSIAAKSLGCKQTYPAVLTTVIGITELPQAATLFGLPEESQTVPAVINTIAGLDIAGAIHALDENYAGPITVQALIDLAKSHSE